MPSPEALAAFEAGEAAFARGAFAPAAQAYRQALAPGPFPAAANNLGNALMALGSYGEALEAYRAADDPAACLNGSVAARALGRMDEARALLERALAADRQNPLAWSALGGLLKDLGRIEPALEAWRAAVALDPANPLLRGVLAYMAAFDPAAGPQDLLREAREWDRIHARHLLEPPPPAPRGPRLRVGYVSPDFRTHCQAFFTVPLFEHHDPARVEVAAYASVRTPDAVTGRLRARTALWRDCAGLSDADLAAQIRHDGLDVLVDLTQHMAGGRPLLFARKPAPIQVAWLAYPGTTGLTAMDYRLTDPFLDPPGLSEGAYSEASLRLPHTYWCYDPLATGPDPGPLPARAAGRVTFGCLNNPCKVHAGVLALWARILEAAPGSRLLLLAHEGQHREALLRHFPDPSRVDFLPFLPRPDYLAAYGRIDLCLDTVPYNGHTTSLDAFWMGVPVLTLVGRTVVGRAGWSQLNNLGLTDLAAWTPEDYVAKAVALAGDLDRLEALRRDLRPRMEASPLMDGAAFARDLEDLYLRMARSAG